MVQYYNDGARENLGYSRLEIIGRYVVELYPSLDEARRVMTAMRSPEHGGPGRVVNFPTTFVAKDGHELDVAISGVILLRRRTRRSRARSASRRTSPS